MPYIDTQTNTVDKPYFDVPILPFENYGQDSRHGAQFFKNVKQLQVGFGTEVFRVDRSGMWAGAETYAAAPWKVDWQGNMTANSVTLTGYLAIGEALGDTQTSIGAGGLSAITANIGTVTAGTITGLTITGGVVQTSAATNVERARMLNSRFEVLEENNNVSGYLRGFKDELSGVGRSELGVNFISMLSYFGATEYMNFYFASGAGGGWKIDINDDAFDNVEFYGVPVASEWGIGNMVSGYKSLTNNAGVLEWDGSPVGTGTVTSIATSGAISGGTITTSGTISHLDTAGYKHIPTGGATDKFLKYSASGTATWEYLSGTSCGSLIPSASAVTLGNGTYYWDDVYLQDIYFELRTGTPSTEGQMFYFDDTVSQEWRVNAGSFQGSIDLTAL